MDKQSIQIAEKFLRNLKKNLNIKKLILFGSRARGDNFLTSDFDFIVVSDDFKNKQFILRPGELYDYWDEKFDIEPICYTIKEFEIKKKQKGIVQEAVKEGIEIWFLW